ncbi:MAG: Ribosome hibernation promoting factor Hpf, partial [uncultured Rubrobacteraceae bacterium]
GRVGQRAEHRRYAGARAVRAREGRAGEQVLRLGGERLAGRGGARPRAQPLRGGRGGRGGDAVHQRDRAQGHGGLRGHVRFHRPDGGQARAAGAAVPGAPDRPLAGPGEERPARPGGAHSAGRGGEPRGADSEDQAVPDEADGGRGGRAPDGPARPRLLRLHERRNRRHQRGLQAAGWQLRAHRARKI